MRAASIDSARGVYAAYYNEVRTHLALGKDAARRSGSAAVRRHCSYPNYPAFGTHTSRHEPSATSGGYRSVNPPSTTRLWPVMKAASSEARNSAAFPIPSGPGRYPSGVRLINSSGLTPDTWKDRLSMSVSWNPGEMALARMPNDPYWRARLRVRPRRALLVEI